MFITVAQVFVVFQKLHVVNGRIVRVTSDDSDYAFDGSYRNKEQYNDARSLTCPKGRAIKYRAHHPAKLRYAFKTNKTTRRFIWFH